MRAGPSAIIEDVIAQHAEEASFLRTLRSIAVRAPNYFLHDLIDLDARIEAHLDGLRVAGDPGWSVCLATLELKTPGDVFTTAVTAMAGSAVVRLKPILEIAAHDAALSSGYVSALGWIDAERAWPEIERLLDADHPSIRRLGIAGAAVHRVDPGISLTRAVADPDPALRARAMIAVGELGRSDLAQPLRAAIGKSDARCSVASAWSLALLSPDEVALQALLAHSAEDVSNWGAIDLAMRRSEFSDAESWITDRAGEGNPSRLVFVAAAALGSPGQVPWLIEQMRNPERARAAGEAFAVITGLRLDSRGFQSSRPDGIKTGPSEDPADEDVAMDPDQALPWPDPNAVAAWWLEHRRGFKLGERYFLGRPITLPALEEILRTGRQRERAAAALEIALRRPNQPLFEVRGRGDRQLSALAGAR